MLRCLSAGESHGKAIVAILEGMPAGLKIESGRINEELRRRQQGFGRGRRMQIEKDRAQVISGLRHGLTLGSPIALCILNKDFSIEKLKKVISPRPGHADLAGFLKYGFSDIRDVLERASARSTAATVGIGAICKIFLKQFNVAISSKVLSIGGENTKQAMLEKVREAINKKDTVGGIVEVVAKGVPAGVGSYAQPDRRLDARLTQNIMSIPGIKAVEIGLGLGYAVSFGSEVHDAIYYNKNKGYFRKSNNAGGIEGGIIAKAIADGVIPPTINLHETDEECDLNYVPNQAIKTDVKVARGVYCPCVSIKNRACRYEQSCRRLANSGAAVLNSE